MLSMFSPAFSQKEGQGKVLVYAGVLHTELLEPMDLDSFMSSVPEVYVDGFTYI